MPGLIRVFAGRTFILLVLLCPGSNVNTRTVLHTWATFQYRSWVFYDKWSFKLPCFAALTAGPETWFFVWSFLLCPILREQAAMALVRQRGGAGSTEPSLFAYVVTLQVPFSHSLTHLVFSIELIRHTIRLPFWWNLKMCKYSWLFNATNTSCFSTCKLHRNTILNFQEKMRKLETKTKAVGGKSLAVE